MSKVDLTPFFMVVRESLDQIAPVEVLRHTIDYLGEAVVMGLNLDAVDLCGVLCALLQIELAVTEGRDFYKRKGGINVES